MSVEKDLDERPFGWFHIKIAIISGMGFFTDTYDLQSISFVTALLGRFYYQDNPFVINTTVNPGKLPIGINAAVTGVALCGTLAGQFFWGWFADAYGRKSAYTMTLAIMIIAGIAQSMSYGISPNAVIGTLCFWRFFLGFGVGGDYPVCSTVMSEYSNTKWRGAFIGTIFAMQGLGILFSAAVAGAAAATFDAYFPANPFPVAVPGCNSFTKLTSSSAAGTCPVENQQFYYKQVLGSCPPEADYVWRIVLMMSCVLAIFVIYSRSKIAETPRYTAQVRKDAARAAADLELMDKGEFIPEEIIVSATHDPNDLDFNTYLWKYKWQIIACSASWFLLDIAFYSQTLFQSQVYLQVGFLPPAKEMYALQETLLNAKASGLIALGSTVPGYWVTVFTVDTLGRKFIQIMGFLLMGVFMAALAGSFNDLLDPNTPGGPSVGYLSDQQPTRRNGWITMYALCFFFANFGPNATTFIYPAELFPAKYKARSHGFAAGCGKAGAIVGAFGFLYASQPQAGDLIWKFPCLPGSSTTWTNEEGASYNWVTRSSDLGGKNNACQQKGNCPTGRIADSTSSTNCNECQPGVLSGCYPFGIGLINTLWLLFGALIAGMFFTFLLPETKGKTLEELADIDGTLGVSKSNEGVIAKEKVLQSSDI